MEAYQLCREEKARHPFYIRRIDTNIYTAEELCYYFRENLCLLDDSILNETLCVWLREELGLFRLANRLKERLTHAQSIGEFVLPIFQEIGYLGREEFMEVRAEIAKLEAQPRDVRKKIRADSLIRYGMYGEAVSLYQQILDGRGNHGKLGLQFYAAVWNNLAGAYARMFLFERAAECLWQSYELVRTRAVYRRYLAILPLSLSPEDCQKRMEELRVPEEQRRSIEEEKRKAVSALTPKERFEGAGDEELGQFLEDEKKKYYRGRLL